MKSQHLHQLLTHVEIMEIVEQLLLFLFCSVKLDAAGNIVWYYK